jgi:hypothetical protein
MVLTALLERQYSYSEGTDCTVGKAMFLELDIDCTVETQCCLSEGTGYAVGTAMLLERAY